MKYLTEYLQGGCVFGSHVYAKDREHAESLCLKRNIGEVIIGIEDSSQGPAHKESDIMHEACFLSFLALKAGTISLDDVLGDKGIVHEIAHAISQGTTPEGVVIKLAHLRKRIPGYEPV